MISINESYPKDGTPKMHARRDLRRGKHKARYFKDKSGLSGIACAITLKHTMSPPH